MASARPIRESAAPLDDDRPADGRAGGPVGGRQGIPAIEETVEGGQPGAEQVRPVHPPAGCLVHPGRAGRGQRGRCSPIPITTARLVGFGQDAGQLAVPDQQVVRPLQIRG